MSSTIGFGNPSINLNLQMGLIGNFNQGGFPSIIGNGCFNPNMLGMLGCGGMNQILQQMMMQQMSQQMMMQLLQMLMMMQMMNGQGNFCQMPPMNQGMFQPMNPMPMPQPMPYQPNFQYPQLPIGSQLPAIPGSNSPFSSGAAQTLGGIGGVVGSVGGSLLGSSIGAALGTALIPIPGVGTVVGSILGGMLGGKAGGSVGQFLGKLTGGVIGLAGKAISKVGNLISKF